VLSLLTLSALPAQAQDCSDYVNGALDDTAANAPGTQFVNSAKWDFGTFENETP
jgi:hypothetical protein